MIRNAVGAIVIYHGTYLLAERTKAIDKYGVLHPIPPEWDLVKGGIEAGETPEEAVLRELAEETGSREYKILRRLSEPLCYGLLKNLGGRDGYERQETVMFLVEHTGDPGDLASDEKEIGKLVFFSRDEAIAKMKYKETRAYFGRHT